MDQIYNHAVKFPGIFSDVNVPMVIRTPAGGYRGYGPTHSQSPENIFVSVPGLTVVFGSHRHNMGNLLVKATIDWPYPVLFFEHKIMYSLEQDSIDYEILPEENKDIPADLFPTMIRKRENPDLTIVTYGGALQVAEKVSDILEKEEEINVEIIVPSLLSPLPSDSITERLSGSPRVVVIEETNKVFGVGSEISANLIEKKYQGQMQRIGSPSIPIPAARSLEYNVLPDADRIIQRIREMF
jgi:2-oxoisovalerate dehydrogenase E1 component